MVPPSAHEREQERRGEPAHEEHERTNASIPTTTSGPRITSSPDPPEVTDADAPRVLTIAGVRASKCRGRPMCRPSIRHSRFIAMSLEWPRMKKTIIFAAGGLCLVAALFRDPSRAPRPIRRRAWNRKAAAAYLDQRSTWWTTWPNAQRDHGTFCVSCHTALPYALARPALRQPLGETGAVAQRGGAARQRHQARDDVARRRAVLSGSDARRPEDERVARHRGDPQRRHSRRAATRARARSATKGAARSTTCGRCR